MNEICAWCGKEIVFPSETLIWHHLQRRQYPFHAKCSENFEAWVVMTLGKRRKHPQE